MGTGLVQTSSARWPADAIRDSTAAVLETSEYARDATPSLFDTLAGWIGNQLLRLLELLPELSVGPWLLISLAILIAALIVARIVMAMRAERDFRAGGPGATHLVRRLDPWTEAERLAASGSYLEAAHALCAALLAASARRGEVTLHPSKTTGDYAREMRRRGAPSVPAFEGFRSRYDRLVYDLQACAADDYAVLRAAAQPLLSAERAA
ncbi:MAG: DUF4129 domain-containing protein [Gemmatimonadaceae bacterium]